MSFIQSAGVKPPLPEMPAAPVHTIDILRVAKGRPADGSRQRFLLVRYRDKMNVIGHKTICKNLQFILIALLFKQLKKDIAVVIDKENVLAIIAPLSDMMRAINCDYSGYPWHSVILSHIIKKVNQKR
jgi:hypothetical protein